MADSEVNINCRAVPGCDGVTAIMKVQLVKDELGLAPTQVVKYTCTKCKRPFSVTL